MCFQKAQGCRTPAGQREGLVKGDTHASRQSNVSIMGCSKKMTANANVRHQKGCRQSHSVRGHSCPPRHCSFCKSRNFIPISTPLGFFTLRSTRILFPAPPRMGQPALCHLSSAKTTQLLSFFRMNYLIPQLCYLPLQSIQGWRLHGKCCTE